MLQTTLIKTVFFVRISKISLNLYTPRVTSLRGVPLRSVATCIFIVVQMCCCSIALSSIYIVNQDESIQAVVDVAANGDSIILNDGSYSETVVLMDKALTIGSRYVLDGDTAHVGVTIVAPDSLRPDTNSCFALFSTLTTSCSMIGLTLHAGLGTHLVLSGDEYLGGGGIVARNQSLRIEECRIVNGSADIGGGVCLYRDVETDTTSAIILNCVIKGCRASHWGGGIYSNHVDVRLALTHIDSCRANLQGGGVFALDRRVDIDTCLISSCFALVGGVCISPISGFVRNCEFNGNGNSNPETFHGTCHLFTSGHVIVSGNHFTNNATEDEAVSIYQFNGWGQDFFTGNIIEHHTMTDFTGAMYTFSCEGEITYNIFRNNFGDFGASLVPMGGGILRIHHNIFTNNGISAANAYMGSAITINEEFNSFVIDSNIFEGNSGVAVGYDTIFQSPNVRIQNNWWGDATGPFHAQRNSTGRGDTLLGEDIEFEPWLTSPPDTALSNVPDNPGRPSIPATWQILSVYPNPFNSTLRIDLAGFARDDFKIALFDLLGRECAVLHVGSTSGGSLSFPAPATLASGIYFLMTRDAHYSVANKVVFLK